MSPLKLFLLKNVYQCINFLSMYSNTSTYSSKNVYFTFMHLFNSCIAHICTIAELDVNRLYDGLTTLMFVLFLCNIKKQTKLKKSTKRRGIIVCTQTL